ncbi:MAG: T9SS type A sorting domain-containing protein [candidate division Zixibacteria bacterium]|nr:T9SS type A sorting domain-containing protein [candidate division Zixibacteria bacterium]
MKKNTTFLLVMSALLLGLVASTQAEVSPTHLFHWFRGDVLLNGQLAPVGTIVDAYDPDLVHCGTYTVGVDNFVVPDSAGVYGWMLVYGDDATEPGDQGAETGDLISFRVMNRPATIDPVFNSWADMEFDTTNLSATSTIGLEIVDPADHASASPCDGGGCDTVRFMVGVENIGNGTDFYGINVTSAKDWEIIPFDTIIFVGTDSVAYVYNQPAQTAYVFFDVVVPNWPGDEPDTLSYEVFSRLDETVTDNSSVTLTIAVSGVGDDPFGSLPERFSLAQNYPNPFNPTTTIAFNLSSLTTVRLEVYDILGRQISEFDFGALSAGDHDYEYDASSLSSGIYFYRLVTELGTQTRKMVLAK